MRHRCRHSDNGSVPSHVDSGADSKPTQIGVLQAKITTLGIPGDTEVRCFLRRALRDAEPAAQRFGWHLSTLCELPADDDDVGYTDKDGTIFVKVRDPASRGVRGSVLYTYSFVFATLLHELVHLTHLGHGKAFYRCLSAALGACSAESYVRREARTHVCAELLNAVCDNDARRAKALLAVMPEAVDCRRPGKANSQLPLEYAAHHGRVALTKLLLEARADPALCGSSQSGKGLAPLARAAVNGNAKTAALLLAARANIAEVKQPEGQTVLEKAIAVAEAGGIAGKNGEWWNVAKVLSENHASRDNSGFKSDAAPARQSRARSHSRRRRKRSSCEEPAAPPPPVPPAPRKSMSMPTLPGVPVLPVLAGTEGSRRPLGFSLAGSLAL